MNAAVMFDSESEHALLVDADAPSSRSQTGAGLSTNSLRVSGALKRIGVSSGDSVLIMSGNRVETFECVLAALRAGAVAIPLSPHVGLNMLERILNEAKPKCCVFDRDLSAVATSKVTHACQFTVLMDETVNDNGTTSFRYADLLEEQDLYTSECSEDQDAMFIYSSGSTGTPKLVRMSHQAFTRFFEWHYFVHSQYLRSTGAHAPIVSVMPPYHFAGLAIGLQGLRMGRPTYLMHQFSAHAYLKLVHHLRCVVMRLVPSMYSALLRQGNLISELDFSALKLCVTVGEPCPSTLIDRISSGFGATVVSSYGMTECLPGIGHRREDLFGGTVKKGSCGRVMFGDVRLVDSAGHRGNIGELWVRNPTTHSHYGFASNKERMVEGFLRTGDLFSQDSDGDFFYCGRTDNMFFCNGKNVYPGELEHVLSRHPDIEMACVAPVLMNGRTVIGAIVKARDALLEASSVIDFCLRHGPLHGAPQIVQVVTDLPQTSGGKIDRSRCAELLRAAPP